MQHAVGAVLRRQLNVGVADQDAAAKGLQQLDDARADGAIADDADRHLRQLAAGKIGAVKVAAPLAGAQRLMPGADHASFRQDCPDGEFGHRAGVAGRRVDDADGMVARRHHVDIDRPAARHRDEPKVGQTRHHRARKRREMRDENLGVADEVHYLVGRAHVFLESVEAGLGIAMLHRLVGPGLLQRANGMSRSAGRLDAFGEDRRQHETVADDRDGAAHAALPSRSACHTGVSARRVAM